MAMSSVTYDRPASDLAAALLEAAAHVIATDGPGRLTVRRVADEVGTSTMAVYTHFGGMGALVDEVAREGFLRLSARLAEVGETDDPVADVFLMARTYRQVVVEQPQLFAVTFGQAAPSGKQATLADLTTPEGRGKSREGIEAFQHLVRAAARAIDAGRFRPVDPYAAAAQLWSALHGFVTLESSGHFGRPEQGIDHILVPLGITLAVGLGDTVDCAEQSSDAAKAAWRARIGNTGPGRSDSHGAEGNESAEHDV